MMHGSFSVAVSDAMCVAQSGLVLTHFLVGEATEGVLLTEVRTTDVGLPGCRARVDIGV